MNKKEMYDEMLKDPLIMSYIEVYKQMFKNPAYNLHPENEFRYVVSNDFLREHKKDIKTMIDIGSGRGLYLETVRKNFPDVHIFSSDLENFHNKGFDFVKINLAEKKDRDAIATLDMDYLTCLDCLEHLDESFIEDVICSFSKAAKLSFLSIANHSDIINGVELHTIRKDVSFWTPIIEKYFVIKNFQTYYGNRLFLYGCRPRRST